ncbi:MAG: riboflavin biosynthesis protein RibF, partial [Lachnospiraceae bacterium]
LVEIVKEKAKYYNVKPVVFTFDGLPESIVPKDKQRFLTLSYEREKIFEELGVEVLIEYPFTDSFMHMEPEVFIDEILVHRLKARVVVVGDDYRFGNRRRGDVNMLVNMAPVYGYEAIVIKKERFEDREISSTYVREELAVGHMETVNMLLKRPFSITGKVVSGNQLGRTLEIPTVNVIPDSHKILPPYGVYTSQIIVDGNCYNGVSNLGVKPTVSDDGTVNLESFIFDFDGDLYGKEIEVFLKHFQRPEMKFKSIEDLVKQMNSDIEFAKAFAL